MADPFVGEIMMFGGNFAPRGWALCDGQLLPIAENDALFSLLGTTYGGDGRTTFGLPDLRGRVPVHQGHGPGLSERRTGSKGGEEHVTLTAQQLPAHGHVLKGSTQAATSAAPAGQALAAANPVAYKDGTATTALAAQALGQTGGNQPHPNQMPYLCVQFCICLYGIYPSRH